jgi:Glycosyl transferase family 2
MIPVYKEKGYIEKTLKALTQQTLYKKGKVHIIVGEYKEPGDRMIHYVESICSQYPHTDYIKVDRKGIGFARRQIIEKLGISCILMCVDSDCMFDRHDAIELMIVPILRREAVFTNCQGIRYDFKKDKITHHDLSLYNIIHSGDILSDWFVMASGPGMTILRKAYDAVGGFDDLEKAEDTIMAIKLCLKFGVFSKKFIDNVHIYTSDRRAKGFEKMGQKAFDYEENYFR